jgi:hypothetical protein
MADLATCRFANAKPETDAASVVVSIALSSCVGCGNTGTLAAQTPSHDESAMETLSPSARPKTMNSNSILKG